MRPERFELPAFWSVARRSIQLSYGRTMTDKADFNTSGILPTLGAPGKAGKRARCPFA